MAWNKYPYTDYHQLNADYILAQLADINSRLDNIVVEVVAQAIAAAEEYVDIKIADVINEFNALKADFDDVVRDFDLLRDEMQDMEDDFADFVLHVDERIDYFRDYIDAQIRAVNLRTDAAIEANNEYLLDNMETYLSDIKVLNYFTGDYVSIQDMFDYLAMLHITDSIDYDTMAARNKTYTEFINMNMTYTNLALHGNTLFV